MTSGREKLAVLVNNPSLPTRPDSQSRNRLVGAIDRAQKNSFYGGVRLYLTFDITNSMATVIERVKRHIDYMGNQVLSKGHDFLGPVEAAVWGVGEHQGEHIYKNRGWNPNLDDYGFIYPPTRDPTKLSLQLKDMPLFKQIEWNWDAAEAYECFAHDLALDIYNDRIQNPGKNYVVWFFGDSCPHGSVVSPKPDDGCRNNRNGDEELRNLVKTADEVYFVDCENHQDLFRKGTYLPVAEMPNSHYYKFSDLEGSNVTQLLIPASLKKIQGKLALNSYLASLPQETSKKVAGLLTK